MFSGLSTGGIPGNGGAWASAATAAEGRLAPATGAACAEWSAFSVFPLPQAGCISSTAMRNKLTEEKGNSDRMRLRANQHYILNWTSYAAAKNSFDANHHQRRAGGCGRPCAFVVR